MQKLFENWRRHLLLESRFSAALEFAQNFNKAGKQWRVKDVFDEMTDEQVQLIKIGMESAIELAKSYDPSGNNAYLLWIARNLRKDLGRSLQKFSKNWNTTPVPWDEKADADDPAQVPFTADEKARGVGARLYNTAGGLQQHITNYHKLKQKNIITKDINDFDPTTETGEFRNYVEGAMQIFREKEEKAALKKKAAEEADEILQNEDYAVIRPNTKDASCLHGWGTKWCISAMKSRNYFDQYSGEGKVFYFVMFRHLSNTNSPYKKTALMYGKDVYSGEPDPEQTFDDLDEEVGEVGLFEGVTDNLLAKVVNQVEAFKDFRDNVKKMKDAFRVAADPRTRTPVRLKNRELALQIGKMLFPGAYAEDEDKNLDIGELQRRFDELVYDKQRDLRDWTARAIENPMDSENRGLALQIGKMLFPDVYAEEIDLDISDLKERFDELTQEQYSDIVGNASYHAEQNPGGPKGDDYEKIFAQYEFKNVYVTYDEYDTNAWYWDGGFSIDTVDEHFADLKLPEDTDLEAFGEQVGKALSDNGIYPDESEEDEYDNAIRLRFTPDEDESQGLDGFERFLERMRDYDEKLDGKHFWDDLATNLMDAGLTAGGLFELRDILEGLEFENVDYEIEGRVLNVWLKLNPILARPKGISGLYFSRMMQALSGYATGPGTRFQDPDVGSAPQVGLDKAKILPQEISARTIRQIDKVITNKWADYWDQLVLPGFDVPSPSAEVAQVAEGLPQIDMNFYPKQGEIQALTPSGQKIPFSPREIDRGAGGINIVYPFDFMLSLTNEQYWDEFGTDDEESAALVKFIQWIDQAEVRDQITALLQASLNDVALEYMKMYPQRTKQDLEKEGIPTHFADVKPEPEPEPEAEPEEVEPIQLAENITADVRSTFMMQEDLNSEIWDEYDQMRPEVADKLMRIAVDFLRKLKLNFVSVKDVVLTGSLANYNWSHSSDLDVHIILDFSEINEDAELVKQFFNLKKTIWNKNHDIRIKDFEVEIYAEDVNELHASTGIYSIANNQWLVKPSLRELEIDWDDINKKARTFASMVSESENMLAADEHEEAFLFASKLMGKIKKFRKCGLEKGGEYSSENLAFKVLRRDGTIGRLIDVRRESYDRMMSLEESTPPAKTG